MSAMPDPQDWSFEACQVRLQAATRNVIDAEREHEQAAARSADAEAVYRHTLAKFVRSYREAGKAVEESLTLARADVATLSRERDYAKDLVRNKLERLEDARDSRRSLWRLIEWARGRDLATVGKDEREPAEQWP